MPESYVYIWVYEVAPEGIQDFLELYGRDGPWVELFSKSPEYLGTELLSDRDQPGRFVTIDRWVSQEAFEAFRLNFADELAGLDDMGEQLTTGESPLGEFRST